MYRRQKKFIPQKSELSKIEEKYGKIKSLKRIDSGKINDVFKLKTKEKNFILKIYNNKTRDNEVQVYKKIKNIVNVPTVYEIGSLDYSGKDYLLMSEIEGCQLSKIKNIPPKTERIISEKKGELLAKIHHITGKYFGSVDGKIKIKKWGDYLEEKMTENIPLIEKSALIDDKIIQTIKNELKKITNIVPDKPRLILRDFWNEHIFVKKENPTKIIGIIDQEEAYFGDRNIDLSQFNYWEKYFDNFLSAYNTIFKVDDMFYSHALSYQLIYFINSASNRIKNNLSSEVSIKKIIVTLEKMKISQELISDKDVQIFFKSEKISSLPLTEGQNNHIFGIAIGGKISPFIVRVNKNNEHEKWNKTAKEFSTLKEIEKMNISPKAYLYGLLPSSSVSYILMDKMTAPVIGYHDSVVHKNLKKILLSLSKLHKLRFTEQWLRFPQTETTTLSLAENNLQKTRDYYTSSKKILLEKIGARNTELLKNSIALAEKWLRKHSESFSNSKLSIVHGDVHGENIFIENGIAKLIDWEFSKLGDSAYDLASLFMNHGVPSKKQTRLQYAEKTNQEPNSFENRFIFYATLACIADTIYSSTIDPRNKLNIPFEKKWKKSVLQLRGLKKIIEQG